MLYRFFTEYKPDTCEAIYNLITMHVSGFTVIGGIGFWQGKKENSLIIEIDAPVLDWRLIAENIKQINSQDAVMVQILDVNRYLV